MFYYSGSQDPYPLQTKPVDPAARENTKHQQVAQRPEGKPGRREEAELGGNRNSSGLKRAQALSPGCRMELKLH